MEMKSEDLVHGLLGGISKATRVANRHSALGRAGRADGACLSRTGVSGQTRVTGVVAPAALAGGGGLT
jgi:hypothetical protein